MSNKEYPENWLKLIAIKSWMFKFAVAKLSIATGHVMQMLCKLP